MCLSYPGKIIKISKDLATIDYTSEKRKAKLISKKFKIGDYVIVQGKIVMEKVDKKSAEKWLEMIHSGKA